MRAYSLQMSKIFKYSLLTLFLCLGIENISANSENTAEEWKAKFFTNYVFQIYNSIDFSSYQKINFPVFEAGLKGMMNLKAAGKIADSQQIISLIDFSLPSIHPRMWIIDLKNKKAVWNDYVAHGEGSGLDSAVAFSDQNNSHKSSLGFYVTTDIYEGKHGISLKLIGFDKGFNSSALKRVIVVHGADYVSYSFIEGQKRLGRSWGCPAVSKNEINTVINYIKGGTCLFIYAPVVQYLKKSIWLKSLPNVIFSDFNCNEKSI